MTAKELASIAGLLISMSLAIGNTARLMSRSMYSQISEQACWFCLFTLADSVRSELVFWLSNLDQRNGRPIWFKSSAVRIAYSDASGTGCGGYIVELGPQVAAQGVWSSVTINRPIRYIYYMANPILGKSLCCDWFFLGQDFVVRTVSMETVQVVYFCFGAKPANSKFATKTAKKTVNIVILHSETTRRS